MAKDKAKDKKETESAEAGAGTAPRKPLKLPGFPIILGLLNTLAILGAVGMLAYTKLVYKRPPITEDGERERLAKKARNPEPAFKPTHVLFEPFTVNIESNPPQPRSIDGSPAQIGGKLHYATLGYTIEILDDSRKAEIESKRPFIMDRVIALLGRKSFQELTTVQGRYLLRNQILDIANELTASSAGAESNRSSSLSGRKPALVTNVFFTQFVVQ